MQRRPPGHFSAWHARDSVLVLKVGVLVGMQGQACSEGCTLQLQ
jgi:hypothetical protein